MEQTKPLYMFDLFAGCGGLSTGLEFNDFHPVLVSELNRDALNSYLINRSYEFGGIPFKEHKKLHFQDIYDLTPECMDGLKGYLSSKEPSLVFDGKCGSTLDLICGGPPCQGYSGIGHRRSYAVEKKDIPSNQLFVKMAEVIETFRPKSFLFENVRGLLSSRWWRDGDKGEIWRDVLKRFNSISGYRVKWSLVHAKDYGVPQNRPRVLLVGLRDDVVSRSSIVNPDTHHEDAVKCGFLPPPIGGAPDLEDLFSDLIDERVVDQLLTRNFPDPFATTRYLSEPQTDIQKRLRTMPDRTIMSKGSKLYEQEYSKHSLRIVEKFMYMIEHNGEIREDMKTKKFAQRVIPRKWNENGPNITATSLPDDYVHYEQPRSLTVREWARLQMFPDWYQFEGKRTTGGIRRAGNPIRGIFDREVPKYTQIGNAVPVGLASEVGKHLKIVLNN